MAKVDLRNLDKYLEKETYKENQKRILSKKKKESSIYKVGKK